MDISTFIWGFVVGVVAGPSVWEGTKWCYNRLITLTQK